MAKTHYVTFALELRAVIDPLIALIDTPRHPHEREFAPLKSELLRALTILTKTESRALGESRG